MKTRWLALILLILGGVFMAEVRLHDTGRMSKKSSGTPTLWSAPAPGSEPPLKFVDPPMPAVAPPTTWERDNRRR